MDVHTDPEPFGSAHAHKMEINGEIAVNPTRVNIS